MKERKHKEREKDNKEEVERVKKADKCDGDVAQMVEHSLSMRGARGSIPRISIIAIFLGSKGLIKSSRGISKDEIE